ncbi:MSF1-domain-containing protein [Sistotremastrum niveocremeum HHB9708]|uniref:MSF1-domain-containing protein n=2 Tax=Sistotremastraceae TaxID=3402574 RepID=A0A164UHA9_9AGAM|nr:MSF1-domain-containing protein [Sistotremastrum niveocremeum HHB9708]KZT36034.1 MSF1-domain-containing protein [Sistotremastrum suecicum HHB10207 ss-3]
MRLFTQSYVYNDPWSIVSLAFLLRYPNPFASHVVSCDVISRTTSPSGTLLTTRLILKKGSLPKWFPAGIVSRAETWVIEESEVDPINRTVRCRTRNLDNVRIMRVEEYVSLQEMDGSKTLQRTEARFLSRFGWGLTKQIESHGVTKFRANIEKSRQGVQLILDLLRESAFRPLPLGGTGTILDYMSFRRNSGPIASGSRTDNTNQS